MNPAQFKAIKAHLENPAVTDVHMSAATWNDFRRAYWPDHATPPPGPVRVWIKDTPRYKADEMRYGECAPVQPDTGYRVR